MTKVKSKSKRRIDTLPAEQFTELLREWTVANGDCKVCPLQSTCTWIKYISLDCYQSFYTYITEPVEENLTFVVNTSKRSEEK